MTKERWSDLGADEHEVLEQLGMTDKQRITCPPPDLLRARREDVLPAELSSWIESHVASCALCSVLERDLAAFAPAEMTAAIDARLRSRLPLQHDAPRRASGFWRWSWRPAVALAAVAMVVIAVRERPKPPAPLNAKSAATEASKPARPLMALEKPPVKLTAAALVFRGKSHEVNRFARDLAPALEAYRRDKFTEAATLFAALAAKYPRSFEANFYQGVSRLLSNDPAGAVPPLTAAEERNSPFQHDAEWYLMLAHQRTGDWQAADAEIRRVCEGHGPYAAKACSARTQ